VLLAVLAVVLALAAVGAPPNGVDGPEVVPFAAREGAAMLAALTLERAC
jgi:hypothetical protein